MAETLNWGILGTGRIAGTFARGLATSRTGRLVAVGSRTGEGASRFGEAFAVPRRHANYDALLADDEVRAVYIATPHLAHAEWAIKAAEAGKHVLCEKPLTLNHAEAMAVVEAAREHEVFLMEGFMYRCYPQTARLVEIIREGTIGDVRVIQASFSFHTTFNPRGRLFDPALGGGGILDVGCYPVSMARLIAGVAAGRDFAEPDEVVGAAHLGATGVDEWAVASLKFPGDILAQLQTGVSVGGENVVRVFGSEGQLLIPSPWLPGRDGAPARIVLLRRDEAEPREIVVDAPADPYAVEADAFAVAIPARVAPPPAMGPDDTLGNMRTLDRWRAAIGLVYPIERPETPPPPVHGRPLSVRKERGPAMRYGRLPGSDKPASRLVMGVDNQRTMPHAAVMFDDFFERGGTTFDTAWQYGGGVCEELLGRWVEDRGLREKVVIIGKGAHTPNCNPAAVTTQLFTSLERLRAEYVDVYMLHRDNPAIPAGEFIDVLNEHQRAGRMRAFGASNWSIERIEAANEYARSHGLAGFAVVSNNFSLARMVEPVWAGCIAASDARSRAWLGATQMPLLPWSSQARGFFTDRAAPDNHSDPELVRAWYSDDNFRRRERAIDLARERSVLPINIALAYVLNQPFPTFPLIGPRTIEETRTALPALDITLTPAELRWLNLEE